MSGEKIRLVVCPVCKTIEELPDFEGPVQYDTLLDVVASRHEYSADHPHPGLKLFDIETKHWNDRSKRLQIIEELKKKHSEGLGDDFYAVKATFQDDAQKCWRQHNKTRNCDDYKKDHKRLVPDTKAERKAIGLAPVQSDRFLCEFCPYHGVVVQRMRADRGDYDYTS